MKIALVLESFDPRRGDMEASTFELARHLLHLKHDVHVVAQEFSKEGLEIPIVPHRIRVMRSPLRRDSAVTAALRSLNADIVHDMGITSSADVFTSPVGSPMGMWQRRLAAAAWWARPWKRVVFERWPRYRRQAELARRQLDRSDSIAVAPSEMVADDYRSIHGLPADRIRVVYPGVDIKKYTPHIRKLRRDTTRKRLGVEANDLLLLAVADKYQPAAWPLAFRAIRRLIAGQIPVHLVIVGDRFGAPAARLADRFGVAPCVSVVDETERIPYYAAADVLVLPTLYAPFSRATLEAAACGLPCITTRQNGTADLLTEETGGYVLTRHSAADLAGRIELFLDSARCQRMGLAARRMAMKYPLDRSLDKIVQIYEELARSRRVEGGGRNILSLPHAAGHGTPARRAA